MTEHKDKPTSVPRIEEVGARLDEPVARNMQLEVARLIGRGHNSNFPGAQPVSFARKHLRELRQRDYYVCEKSDGIRCLLYFSAAPNGEVEFMPGEEPPMMEVHYLIDRKNNYYYVDGMHFPRAPEPPKQGSKAKAQEIEWQSYHVDTLLDGELLIDTYPDGRRVLKYLVFDCLTVDGQNLMSRTLDKRLAYFMDKIYNPYSQLCKKFPEDTERFRFKVEKKSFQFAYGTQMMFRDILPKLMHGSDGLIFTCRETPYKFGTDECILKWKPAWENTIDFQMELVFPPLGEDEECENHNGRNEAMNGQQHDYDALPTVILHVDHGSSSRGPESTYTLHLTPSDWATMKSHAIATNDGLDGAIVECHRDTEGRWRFNRFREDKMGANYVGTVEKVIESIEDAVTEEELVEGAGEVRSEWKRRAGEEEEKAKKAREAEEKARRARELKRKPDGEGVQEKRVKMENYEVKSEDA